MYKRSVYGLFLISADDELFDLRFVRVDLVYKAVGEYPWCHLSLQEVRHQLPTGNSATMGKDFRSIFLAGLTIEGIRLEVRLPDPRGNGLWYEISVVLGAVAHKVREA